MIRLRGRSSTLSPEKWLHAIVWGHKDWLDMNHLSNLPDPKFAEHNEETCWKCKAYKAAHEPWREEVQ